MFISLQELARRTGLPTAWLRAEAGVGRLPSLIAGRRLMFNLEAVESALLDRVDERPAAPSQADRLPQREAESDLDRPPDG